MSRILIFSGTTEGRQLSEILSASSIDCDVCVATEYGEHIMDKSPNVNIICKRLNEDDMKKLYMENEYALIVDATHPYATVVTDSIKKSVEGFNIPLIRVTRKEEKISGSFLEYDSLKECAEELDGLDGNILLTTGSKGLKEFLINEDLKNRTYVRVIPSVESIQICNDNGINGGHIIAMQGPFSMEMNCEQINHYNVKHLVTKQSGKSGGEFEKIQAAKKCGVTLHVIKRPDSENDEDIKTVSEAVKIIETITNKTVDRKKISISLAGIGCGDKKSRTVEVNECIKDADYIFGAPRMLEGIESTAIKCPYYLANQIIPEIEKIYNDNPLGSNIAILFSGDSGFYSGCSTLLGELEKLEYVELNVFPGISSIQALAAKCHISWHDGNIISAHGRKDDSWLSEILYSIKYNKKTFFITSGAEDINKIGTELEKHPIEGLKCIIGYNISYPDERITGFEISELKTISKKGLYAGVIINDSCENRILTPNLHDNDFIRSEKIPMTKESIRRLSICQMNLCENSVVYDIGSGTGSVSVEMALLSPKIKVYAIECKDDAVELTKENQIKNGVLNLLVKKAMAPEGLDNLPVATHAFIGGSRGNLKAIIDKLYSINPKMRIVMNAVSIESIGEMNSLLKDYNFSDVSVVQVTVNSFNTLGNYNMPSANNPVFIFSFNLS